jgi:hypothetical protein
MSLTWRCHKTSGAGRVPLFGPLGLMNQLGVQEYARERKLRERINSWLKLFRLYWRMPGNYREGWLVLGVDRALAVSTRASEVEDYTCRQDGLSLHG